MSARDDLVMGAVSGKRANGRGWVRANCPFCALRTGKEDRKQCLGLRVDTGKWHCFKCHTGGLLAMLPDDYADFVPSSSSAEEERVAMEPPDGFVPLFEGDDSFVGDVARDYLAARGLDARIGREAKIGAVFAGRLRQRVVVPILDVDETTWLGWSARAYYDGAERKYLNPPGMRRAEILYNHRALHVVTERPAYVVEGVFDALALWPDAVAVLGKPSQQQRDALALARRPMVVVLDGDAWREGEALARLLRAEGARAGFIRLSAGEDPDQVDRAALDLLAVESLTEA